MIKVSLTPDEPEFSQRHEEAVNSQDFSEQDLQRIRSFIRLQVIHSIGSIRDYVAPELLNDEIEELTQIAWCRYWKTARGKYIQYGRAYAIKIVGSLVIDITRRRRVIVGLPVDASNELLPGTEIIACSNGIDPALEIEIKESLIEATGYIHQLPRVQQQAMLVDIKTRFEHIPPIVQFLRKHGLDINSVRMPVTARELKNHQASLHLAKSKLRNMRKENDYK
jgi:DNA-directed RNA polymerase specialized sigma24 family protein